LKILPGVPRFYLPWFQVGKSGGSTGSVFAPFHGEQGRVAEKHHALTLRLFALAKKQVGLVDTVDVPIAREVALDSGKAS